MNMLLKGALFAATIAVAGSINSSPAEALTWRFDNVEYVIGGTITGSFDYDADTNTYSNIDIISTAGSSGAFENGRFYPGPFINYTGTSSSGFGSPAPRNYVSNMVIGESSVSFFLDLEFARPLTNAGGTIDLINRTNLGERAGIQVRRIDTTNFNPTVTTVPVPFEFEASLGLIAPGGMFGGYVFNKKRKANKQLNA
ncbi:hypothetical protein Pse7367_3885 (plasmid) [Thalassoporum mexicanum PCC 7367]|uniref:PFE-CTERM domain-containing protein n=1 Tax=Thalassoporum mexicanum TaxID=3457544 RepID=UPI00029FB5EB|nr:hypothetical protein [Pseudanabaena sp. PCC 7367]AFY72106.1 hypothetical protein Pse7367_3885 [Pseudanabaena sp. PCC 7367]